MLRVTTVPALDEMPELVHGFEQRLGPHGWETREGARHRVASALAGAGRLLLLRQVHGATVLAAPWEGQPEGDAATADEPGLLLGIETADCLPVLLADPQRRAVAAAHAGWRGTLAGVVGAAVEALLAGGSRPQDLVAALGPCIGPCCYEVGEELVEQFGIEGAPFFRPDPDGRPHLDLRSANTAQLARAGLAADRIYQIADCTFCRADLYHSYRREGVGGGRMISFLGWSLPDTA